MNLDILLFKEDLDKNLSAHHQTPTDTGIALNAFLSAQKLLEVWVIRTPATPSKTIDDRHPEIQLMDTLVQYQYLEKVCQALAIRDTYGPELYRHHIIQEISDITDFLRLHLKMTPPKSGQMFPTPGPLKVEIASTPPKSDRYTLDPLIQPYLLYRQFVESEKELLDTPPAAIRKKRYTFIKSQSAGMELVEGFFKTDSFRIDGEKPSLAGLAEMWQDVAEQSINNLYHKKRVVLSRKKDQTPYLTEMVNAIKEEPPLAKKKASIPPKGSA